MKDAEFYHLVLQGHRDAIAFVTTLADVSQTMDDIVDQDTPLSRERVQACFWNMLIGLPQNPFYQAHFTTLNTVMRHALTDWFVANELEHGTDSHSQSLAFVLRDNLVQVLNECVLLIGGYAWLKQHRLAIRLRFHDEPLDTYIRSLP